MFIFIIYPIVGLIFPNGDPYFIISSYTGIIFTILFCTMTIIDEIRKIKTN
jgi:hypothetical protein